MNNEQREALISAGEFNLKLMICVKEASNKIRNGEVAEGYQLVATMTQGVEWLTKVITSNSEVFTKRMDVAKLNDTIREMIESIENGDNGLLGDLLEYEVVDLLEEWQSIIEESLE